MQRIHQLVFVLSLVALSWLVMTIVHELGHVVGAYATGGSVARLVLHPLLISRTDVSPNPHPAVVVWLGPIVGSLVPLAAFLLVPKGCLILHKTAQFFAGYCLIANGTYISVGSLWGIGDSGDMLRIGIPRWTMIAFGVVTVAVGLLLWHRLGSLRQFVGNPHGITPRLAYGTLAVLVALVAAETILFPVCR